MVNLITAKSPAAFAEEYILSSIWNGKFAADTILPAERELSEQIGVTRTTLREVLQRLARDGWLDIQHGKPTRVNNIWETAGLHSLDTILRLDEEGRASLTKQILDLRIQFSLNCFLEAVQTNSSQLAEFLTSLENLNETAESYIKFDDLLYKQMAKLSGNPIYRLVFNGFEKVYNRIGYWYFSHQDSRVLAKHFYCDLKNIIEVLETQRLPSLIHQYQRDTSELWNNITLKMDLSEKRSLEIFKQPSD